MDRRGPVSQRRPCFREEAGGLSVPQRVCASSFPTCARESEQRLRNFTSSRFRAISKGFPEFANEANRSIPILMCHGDADVVVQERYARATFQQLEESGVKLERIAQNLVVQNSILVHVAQEQI